VRKTAVSRQRSAISEKQDKIVIFSGFEETPKPFPAYL
jgi:F0F1-type ATP synthase membrane subunit c/vacuolar-type H+-ATPase subunit K